MFRKAKIRLEDIRNIPIGDLINKDMEDLKELQRQAKNAVFRANLTKRWIEDSITFKKYEESRRIPRKGF